MSENRRRRVLVTDGADGQSRSALAAVRALGSLGYAVTVTTSGESSLASSSRYCDRRISVPRFDATGYAAAVRTELASESYIAVFAASDGAIIALGDPAADLVDKVRLASRAIAAGVATLPTVEFDNGEQLLDAEGLSFPIVVKPREKAGGFAEATRIDDRRSLILLAPSVKSPVVVQPFIDAPLHAIAGVAWKGRIAAVVHQQTLRTWPVACGVSSAAETIEPDVDKEELLRALLHGHDGIFQAQYLGDFLIDVNPRVYGSLPLAVAAGSNLPAIVCQCELGREPDLVRARVGLRYRWFEGDVRNLWFRASHRALGGRELAAAALPRRRTAHSVESFVDPWPAAARMRYLARKWRR